MPWYVGVSVGVLLLAWVVVIVTPLAAARWWRWCVGGVPVMGRRVGGSVVGTVGGGVAYQKVKPLMPGTVSRVEFFTQVKLPNLGTLRPLPMRSTSSM